MCGVCHLLEATAGCSDSRWCRRKQRALMLCVLSSCVLGVGTCEGCWKKRPRALCDGEPVRFENSWASPEMNAGCCCQAFSLWAELWMRSPCPGGDLGSLLAWISSWELLAIFFLAPSCCPILFLSFMVHTSCSLCLDGSSFISSAR